MINNIGFGCVPLTMLGFKYQALRLLHKAFDEGVIHFDTAPLYGNGYSEKILGEFAKTKKGQITITTKFGLQASGTIALPIGIAMYLNFAKKKIKRKKDTQFFSATTSEVEYRRIDKSYIKNSFEKSIKSLRVKQIDYYMLHEALPCFLTDEAFLYLEKLKSDGDILKTGVAVNSLSILKMQPVEYDFWDVLQYENGSADHSDKLLKSYSKQMHFYHSVFKNAGINQTALFSKDILPGLLLLRAARKNPTGKTLFSTSKIVNLKKNISTLHKYSCFTDVELDKLLETCHL